MKSNHPDPIAMSIGRRFARLLPLLFLFGCDPGPLTGGPSLDCSEVGVQCQLSSGPLGVCERTICVGGQTSPCFVCTPQH